MHTENNPTLLLAAAGALMAVVAAVWLLAETSAGWAVVVAVATAVAGMAGLLLLVGHQLRDGDEDGENSTSPRPRAAEH